MMRSVWVIALLSFGLLCNASAQDTIWIAPQSVAKSESDWYPRSIQKLHGKIQLFDAKQLRLLVDGDEAATLIAAHRVLWIEPDTLSDPEQAALEQFAAGKYSESLRPLIDSLNSRPPVWRQQWISMIAANAAAKSSRPAIALELVSQLDARPLPPLVLAWLPVDWTGDFPVQRVNAATLSGLRDRLADKSAAVRLTAASWLLATSARTSGKGTLEKLAVDNRHPVIARLAEIVLWRTATPPVVKEQSGRWLTKIDSLPLVLQTGPTRTLVQRMRTSGMKSEAQQLQAVLDLVPMAPTLP